MKTTDDERLITLMVFKLGSLHEDDARALLAAATAQREAAAEELARLEQPAPEPPAATHREGLPPAWWSAEEPVKVE